MFGKAFKPVKHYVFDYKPRYYNERKERLAALQKEYENNEVSQDNGGLKLIKNNLKSDWVRNKKMASSRAVTIRLAIIISILVGIAAYILELHKLF